ncbi:GntR family transcriptional regulator [Gordonia bronchialis]|uniref:GntR family transcriptional regulator n=1 Tax=Gordonia bronchialis TaxID=2054 RepID=UPI00226E1F5E|nr:GntR family transcriptional regulator [Gordonia bronchialis]
MLIRIDPSDRTPIFEQIAAAVRGVIMRGEVEPGDRLPAARDLAVSLDVNVHTVLRAYQQLRDDGIVELRRGRGAVVSPRADSRAELDDVIDRVVETAKRLGMTAADLSAEIMRRY